MRSIELGVEPGDRVSFITFNTHHLLEAYYGVIEAGAVLNPINIRLAPHEIEYILGHAASKVVFFHRDFTPLIEAIAPRLATRPTFVLLDGEDGPGRSPTTNTRPSSPRARPTRATPRSTRTRSPSCSTRAGRPGYPRAWR